MDKRHSPLDLMIPLKGHVALKWESLNLCFYMARVKKFYLLRLEIRDENKRLRDKLIHNNIQTTNFFFSIS